MTRLHDLAAAGTSPWLDNIRRSWLESGVFRRKVDDGIVGVTSNPTIFQKAIADSSDYDEAIRATHGESAQDVFFELAIKDVQDAADQLKDVYEGTGHLDGFVSFELPPGLANDEAGSIAAAPDFWKRIARPNIFIKIPGTAEGVKAIEESIAAGVNVNVTLLFSLERYDEIHWAFIRGLERRVEAGEPIDDVHSVASFFVSRVDTAVDKKLGDGSPLAGKAAVANAKMAYQQFVEITASDRWKALEAAGARVQRPLWASTGTKNPAYSDVLYVETLIGPRCVNTMPDQTIDAFMDHGTVARTVDADLDETRRALADVAAAGVSLDDVTRQLEIDGVKAFSESFDSLLETIEERLGSVGERTALPKPNAENPLRTGLRVGGATEPALFTIFGATGDLSQRKLLPAIYNLAHRGLLPAQFALIGYSRTQMDDDSFRRFARAAIEAHSRTPVDDRFWPAFARMIHYQPGGFDDDKHFHDLASRLTGLDKDMGGGSHHVFYLSTPSSFFPVIVRRMGNAKLNRGSAGVRIVIEKPFGHDLQSARDLAGTVHRWFKESQVYRIDHYLGKETVQNIYALRFANTIFEPIWSNGYVDHVQLTVAESLGVEHRAAFYEETGVVRDIVQNHLLQVLSLVAMEPPAAFEAEAVRDEKAKLLRAVRPMAFEDSVRGQYGPGYVAGDAVDGYWTEPNVPADSATPSYIAAKLEIDNWRWAGTPFYIRTGKRLAKRVTEVAVQFKRPPHLPFSREASEHLEANSLVLRIQPDEGISLRFGAKAPSPTLSIRSVNMDFLYGSSFLTDVPEAYETLILDAIKGDGTLFTRQDSVERSWEICDPLLEQWRIGQPQIYPSGSWGPDGADELLARDGRRWRRP